MERAANVLLRVPGLALLDLLYRWDVKSFPGLLRPEHPPLLHARHAWSLYYLGHVLCAVLLMLPVRYLVKMYLYILTLMLLYVGHQTARDYIRREVESEYHGAVYRDTVALHRVLSVLTGQVIVSTLCSLLMKTRQAWLFSAPMLPLMARICGIPLQTLPLVNTFATILTSLEVLYVLVSNLFVPLKLAKTACREVVQVLEVYRFVALGMMLWNQLAVPILFLVFWLVLYSLQVYFFLTSRGSRQLTQQGLLFVFLNSVAECCATPYSLIGLTFTVSYLALGLLNLCKFYLVGFSAFQNGNVMHRGVTEGVTLLLLALQTGLLDLQVLQRTFLLSIILFIVVTSTLQSMIEITDPIVLSLGASRNRSPWKHIRGISMCLFLLIFPSFMAYKISRFFHMDFWLLILVSSCMLTSLQVMGTLFIYALFMVELFQDNPLEKMDEIIYYVNAVSRVLEFLVAVCVVGYGTWESLFGEWSWMGASVIIIHSYLNVWLRAQSGWKSFLLRREASKKINSLPKATREQLLAHNDVCAICFQDMSIAVITTCGHFFHAGCLRKWLYVQDTCPMCHHQVNPLGQERNRGAPEAMNEREEQAAAPRANGSELAGANAEAASQEQEGCEPAGEKPEVSTQGCEEPLPEDKKVDAVAQVLETTHHAPEGDCLTAERIVDLRNSALLKDSSSMVGVAPCCASGKEEMFDEDCFKSGQMSSIEQTPFLLSAITENSPSCVNKGIPEKSLSAAGDSSSSIIIVEDGTAHRLHGSQWLAKDNVQRINSKQAETETTSSSSIRGIEREPSEVSHRPEVFETESYSSGPSTIESNETDLHTSSLQRVANDHIFKDHTEQVDDYPS